jgi:hypothetical protein
MIRRATWPGTHTSARSRGETGGRGVRAVLVGVIAALLAVAPSPSASAGGRQLWVSHYASPGNGDDLSRRVAVSPDGTKVFVTGESCGTSSDCDYGLTVWAGASPGRSSGDNHVTVVYTA